MKDIPSFRQLSNAELVAVVSRFAHNERSATAQFIASLAEFDRRRLYLDEGFRSMYEYCIRVLRLSEHAAYGRIEAARLARKFPCILRRLEDGSLSLTTICLLGRHLTESNHVALLEEASHKRKPEVQRIVARLDPKADVPSSVRKLPAPRSRREETVPALTTTAARPLPDATTATVADAQFREHKPIPSASSQLAPGPLLGSVTHDHTPPAHLAVPNPPAKPAIAPLAPERYKIQITVDQETHDVLRQAQDLMRHTVPNGDPAAIISRALRVLVVELLKKKAAMTEAPRPPRALVDGSRVIPASVKREVWVRDAGQCAFEGARGRCRESGALEYHHVIPYALGGDATVNNIELRCRAHNAHEARLAGLPLGPGGRNWRGC